jgi:methylated-DNA-protein-cysteine methyltransferase-like protein
MRRIKHLKVRTAWMGLPRQDPVLPRLRVMPPGSPEPPAPAGFDQRVYAAVLRIPHGRLATYGQIADLIGAYGCARQVGWALRRLPLPSPVPWQRVVNARGQISFNPSREGSDWIQAELLRAEGIPVDGEGRLPLGRYLWVPPLEDALDG